MRLVGPAVLLLVAIVVPVASSQHKGPDDCTLSALGPSSALAQAQSGCCRFAGGVCGCRGGRAQCCKGNTLSSCPCGGAARAEPEPRMRSDPREGPVLRLREVLFADQKSNRPLRYNASFKVGQPLWMWVELLCPDLCLIRLAGLGDPELKVSVYWYFDPGSNPLLREDLKTDHAVKTDAPPLRAVIPARLTPGDWIAEVGHGPDRICLPDDITCSFRVRVTP
jgi:hypothetical protein